MEEMYVALHMRMLANYTTFFDKKKTNHNHIEMGAGGVWVKFPFKRVLPTAVVFSSLVYFLFMFQRFPLVSFEGIRSDHG